MNSSGEIKYPPEWESLSAPGTRHGIMYTLLTLVRWEDNSLTDQRKHYLKSIVDVFFDDTEFSDNPESMIGQSIFPDEIDYVKSLGDELSKFISQLNVRSLLSREASAGSFRRDLKLPKTVIDKAELLFRRMESHGAPNFDL